MTNYKFISTQVHGNLDYPSAALLMAAPWALGFSNRRIATILPVAIGAVSALTSAGTDHERGLVKKIPMKAHLGADIISGALLAASPWLFGFKKKVWLPHLLLGLFQMGTAIFTQAASKANAISGKSIEEIEEPKKESEFEIKTEDKIREIVIKKPRAAKMPGTKATAPRKTKKKQLGG